MNSVASQFSVTIFTTLVTEISVSEISWRCRNTYILSPWIATSFIQFLGWQNLETTVLYFLNQMRIPHQSTGYLYFVSRFTLHVYDGLQRRNFRSIIYPVWQSKWLYTTRKTLPISVKFSGDDDHITMMVM